VRGEHVYFSVTPRSSFARARAAVIGWS